MTFQEWMLAKKGLSFSTVKHYAGAIFGSLARNPLFSLQGKTTANITDPQEFQLLVEVIRSKPEFRAMNARGNNMYSAALNNYLRFLKEAQEINFLAQEVQDILENTQLSETERKVWVNARLGQGKYRSDLLRLWEGKCSVTGFSDERFLIASHIKPWALANDQERLDPFNGLLLTPNLDKAFDLGIISFNPQEHGKIIFSNCIQQPDRLGISDQMKISMMREGTSKYLDFHKKRILLSSW